MRTEGETECGHQMNLIPVAAQKSECVIETFYNWTLLPPLLGRSIWRLFRARRYWMVGFQG